MFDGLMRSHRLRMIIIVIAVLIFLNSCEPGGGESTQIITPILSTPTVTIEPGEITTPTAVEAITPLPGNTPTQLSPSSSTSEGLIVFSSDLDGDFEIWVMSSDGNHPHQLTDNEQMDVFPSWSADGSQIAFISNRNGNDEIYSMNADGSHVRQLTNSASSESFPAFSPDGTQISFDSDREGSWDIYRMTSDGSELQRLTDHPGEDWISSWSPDASQIAFESKRDGNYEIYVMDPDGGSLQRLTEDPSHDGFPSFSPDGTQIAFVSNKDGNYEIYVMSSDGSGKKRVTDNPAEDSDPAWSPDGKWLAFVSNRDGNAEIYTMEVDGGNVRQITSNGARNWSPDWQPSGGKSSAAKTWISKFEGSDYGAIFDIVAALDGNILAVGATNHLHMPPYSGDALIMKLTLDGEVLWERSWGGDGYEQGWATATSAEGGYYIFGETDSFGAGDRDFFLLKISGDGAEEWFKTYGREHREWPFGMLQLSNADLLLYGFTEPSAGSGRSQYALRVGPDGNVIWEYTSESSEEEFVLDAIETSQGDLVLAVNTEEDGKLVKLDRDGNILWVNRYALAGWQYASQVAQTSDGDFLMAGFSMSDGPPRQADTWLGRASSSGELEWETAFGDPTYDDYAISLIRLSDGSYLVGAISNGLLLSRVDENGEVLWRHSLLGQTVHGADGLLELEDGGFLVAGFIQLINGRSYDAIILRTDAQGRVKE